MLQASFTDECRFFIVSNKQTPTKQVQIVITVLVLTSNDCATPFFTSRSEGFKNGEVKRKTPVIIAGFNKRR